MNTTKEVINYIKEFTEFDFFSEEWKKVNMAVEETEPAMVEEYTEYLMYSLYSAGMQLDDESFEYLYNSYPDEYKTYLCTTIAEYMHEKDVCDDMDVAEQMQNNPLYNYNFLTDGTTFPYDRLKEAILNGDEDLYSTCEYLEILDPRFEFTFIENMPNNKMKANYAWMMFFDDCQRSRSQYYLGDMSPENELQWLLDRFEETKDTQASLDNALTLINYDLTLSFANPDNINVSNWFRETYKHRKDEWPSWINNAA